jgi:site-specific DNA-adenine methylase
MDSSGLKAPFPWFGGKSRVADIVWQRFGDVPNYVEPFAGSLAVLLGRPHDPKVETVNDLDCYLANFWRALSVDPHGVAAAADWPVNEADLSARHQWLVDQAGFRERMKTDPEFYDAKVAGWWVWGICSWIGSGWCDANKYRGGDDGLDAGQGVNRKLPHLGNAGIGVNRQLPHLGNAGRGVNRQLPHLGAGRGVNRKLPHLGNAGRGVNRQLPHLGNAGIGVNRQLPHLGDAGRGVNRQLPHLGDAGRGVNPLFDYFDRLAERLRRVRVCCGDWSRVLSPAVTEKHGVTGVFLDPPYTDGNMDYSVGGVGGDVSAAVREWAIENGDNPKLRIALCGYDGEHAMPESWECVAWKANGGYGSRAAGQALENSKRERIWFSPHCLRVGGGLWS